VFNVQAYQIPTEVFSTWCRAVAFFSASVAALSQEVADGKINAQSASALNTRYHFNRWSMGPSSVDMVNSILTTLLMYILFRIHPVAKYDKNKTKFHSRSGDMPFVGHHNRFSINTFFLSLGENSHDVQQESY
jgi:hypothetical protein